MSNTRDTDLVNIRPIIEPPLQTVVDDDLINFQQFTLRPILKLQHPVIMLIAINFLEKSNKNFNERSKTDRLNILHQTIKGNLVFKKLLTGIIIGQFTVNEMSIYLSDTEEINKRITEFLFKRISSAI